MKTLGRWRQQQQKTTSVLDLGTSQVVLAQGHVGSDNGLAVESVAMVPTRGLARGLVVDLQALSGTIAQAASQVEQRTGQCPRQVWVSLSGEHLDSVRVRGVVVVSQSGRRIHSGDIERTVAFARSVYVPIQRELVHVIPQTYMVDGHDGVVNPMGLHATRLEAVLHLVTAESTWIRNVISAVNRAGMDVAGLVAAPHAAGLGVTTAEGRQEGAVVLCVGKGLCQASVYRQGRLWAMQAWPWQSGHEDEHTTMWMTLRSWLTDDVQDEYNPLMPVVVTGGRSLEDGLFESLEEALDRSVTPAVVQSVTRQDGGVMGATTSTTAGLLHYALQEHNGNGHTHVRLGRWNRWVQRAREVCETYF